MEKVSKNGDFTLLNKTLEYWILQATLRNLSTILDSNVWSTHLGEQVKLSQTFKSYPFWTIWYSDKWAGLTMDHTVNYVLGTSFWLNIGLDIDCKWLCVTVHEKQIFGKKQALVGKKLSYISTEECHILFE